MPDPRLTAYEAQKLARGVEWLTRHYRKADGAMAIVYGRALQEMLKASLCFGVEYLFVPGEVDAPSSVTWRMIPEEPCGSGSSEAERQRPAETSLEYDGSIPSRCLSESSSSSRWCDGRDR